MWIRGLYCQMLIKIKKFYVFISPWILLLCPWIMLNKNLDVFLIYLQTIIIHELSHIMMVLLLHEKIRMIKILPCGCSCTLRNQSLIKSWKMILILLAGPLINLIFCRIKFFSESFREANFLIGILNLLPFFELDGGNIMKIVAKLIRLW